MKVNFNGYTWEITYILKAHYGTFYFLKRIEGNKIIMREVEESLIGEQNEQSTFD